MAIAAAAHIVLLVLLSVGLDRLPPMMPSDPDITPIEYVEIGPEPTVTRKPEPTMEAAPREVDEPPETLSEPEPEPTPAPAPASPKVADDAPQDLVVEEKPAPPKPKPKPTPAPAKLAPPKPAPQKPAKSKLDTGALASLIDKAIPEAPVRSRETSAFAKSVDAATPVNARVSAQQVATLEQAIRSQIAPCWNPPLGGTDVQQMTAVLKISLKRDGSVASPPVFVSQTGVQAGNENYARAFVETAKRAVLRCAPLKLPDDLYNVWREFELNFDPRLMT